MENKDKDEIIDKNIDEPKSDCEPDCESETSDVKSDNEDYDSDDVVSDDHDVYTEILSYMNGIFIDNYDTDVTKFEKNLLERLNKYGINEEVANKMYFIFITSAGFFITMNIKTIFFMFYYLLYGSFIFASSFGISFAIVGIITKLDNTDVVDFFEKDDEMKRLEFQNSNYEELFNMISLDLDKKDEEYLKQLKETENHYSVDIPFHPAKKVIMYYDFENEQFVYFTQCGDLIQNHLNAICRMYCLEKKTPELYKDSDDLKFMHETYGPPCEEIPENAYESELSNFDKFSDRKNSFENLENKDEKKEESLDKKDEQSGGGWGTLFMKPKKLEKKPIEEDKKELDKKEEVTINKFIKQGLISDYDFDLNKKNINKGNENASYKSFLHQMMNKKKND